MPPPPPGAPLPPATVRLKDTLVRRSCPRFVLELAFVRRSDAVEEEDVFSSFIDCTEVDPSALPSGERTPDRSSGVSSGPLLFAPCASAAATPVVAEPGLDAASLSMEFEREVREGGAPLGGSGEALVMPRGCSAGEAGG
jgi:hypothetical protein